MITTLVFRDTRFSQQNPPPDSLGALRAEAGVMLWVDLCDPTGEEIKQVLETTFQFHPLAIEDCVADTPFPKLEDYEEYLYLVMHSIHHTKESHFETTELDLFLGKNFLVTFHRKPIKAVTASHERLLRNQGTLVRGPDRVAHLLLDLLIDTYKPVLTELQAELDSIEADALRDLPPQQLFPRIVHMRKEFASLSRIVRPQRQIAAELSSGKTKLIRSVLIPYLRDLSEDLERVETQANAWSEQLILSFRVYLNKSSHEANAGIKVLTAIAALTIPVLTIGAWYGMNFKAFPELESNWGYPLALVVTFSGTFGMLWAMRKKKWL